MEDIIKTIRKELRQNSDEKIRETGQGFFKERIECYGVKAAVVGKVAKEYFKLIKDYKKSEVFELCEILWQSGYLEESFIACNWSYYFRNQYEPEDFRIFEKWANNYISNWASCDTLSNHTIGSFLEMYPEFLPALKDWANSNNRWMRRVAAVSLIVPARRGKFLNDILGIADILLLDKEDLVQKGYGWMLKAASQEHPKEIFEYVLSKKTIMPRTALRYAIEKLPPEWKKIAMEK